MTNKIEGRVDSRWQDWTSRWALRRVVLLRTIHPNSYNGTLEKGVQETEDIVIVNEKWENEQENVLDVQYWDVNEFKDEMNSEN